MKRGVFLSLLGLILGIAIGGAILFLKNWGAKQLMGLLEEELIISCADCRLQYDSTEMSLLMLSGVARNARVVKDGKTYLFFSRVEASFSLREIREHRLVLTELRLKRGWSDGFSPRSVTFRFIDQLATPPPPERDYPGRWKVKLMRIRVSDARFFQRFGPIEVTGTGAGLRAARTPADHFELNASVAGVSLKHADGSTFKVGKLSAEMLADKGFLDIKRFRLDAHNAALTASAYADTTQANKLTGRIQYRADSDYLKFPEWIKAALGGEGSLGGSLENPVLHGTISNQPDRPLELRFSDKYRFSFDSIDSTYLLGQEQGALSAAVNSLTASGAGISLSLKEPLNLRGGSLSGALALKLDSLSAGGVTLSQIDTTTRLRGPLTALEAACEIGVGNLAAGSQDLGGFSGKAQLQNTALHFSFSADKRSSGSLQGEGVIRGVLASPRLENLNFRVVDFGLASDAVRFSLQGQANSRENFSDLNAQAAFQLSLNLPQGELPLAGQASFKQGKLLAKADNQERGASIEANADLQGDPRGEIALTLNNFTAFAVDRAKINCHSISASALYQFKLGEPLLGNGRLDLGEVFVGCEPYRLALAQPRSLDIRGGTLNVQALTLQSATGPLTVDGALSLPNGYRLAIDGSLDMQALLTLLPDVDDMRGSLRLAASLSGPLDSPRLSGKAKLTGAGLDIHDIGVTVRETNGSVALENSLVRLENIQGKLNEGVFEASGDIDLRRLNQSSSVLSFRDVSFEAPSSIGVLLSGELKLVPGAGEPAIQGTVNIDSASLERSFDWAMLARSLRDAVFSRQAREKVAQRAASFPPVALNIRVSAPDNLVLSTNLGAAEMAANLQVTGTLASPSINGRLETLGGWFGLKDRRFEITSGTITFRPPSILPSIEIIGETSLRSREGDIVLVFLEVSGPLTTPRVTLSSDRGLTDREILTLLTSSSEVLASRPQQVSTLSQDVEIDTLPFLSDASFLGFGRFVRNLAKIDSISFEPAFNSQRGTLEPTFVARKHLFDRITLIGESSFSGGPAENRLRANYEFYPWLTLSGIAEAATAEKNAAVGADLTFTILSGQKRKVEVEVEGNRNFSDSELIAQLRIQPSAEVKTDDLPLLEKNLSNFYRGQGYFDAVVTAACDAPEPPDHCAKVSINVEERRPAVIEQLEIRGETLPKELKFEKIQEAALGRVASAKFLESFRTDLVAALRTEGYISARMNGGVEPLEPAQARMWLEIRAGKPVTFIFNGNSVFSASDFLKTIDLWKRKQPFGNNTINILVQNMDRLYNESGYLFAVIRYSRREDPDGNRTIYEINVDEGDEVKVSNIVITGNGALPRKRIVSLVKESSRENYKAMFEPNYAIHEQIQANGQLLEELYQNEGFPEASVLPRLHIDDVKKRVKIEYAVTEGEPLKADWISVSGWPKGIAMPEEPPAPYSIPAANRYVESLLDTLSREGFVHARVDSNVSAAGQSVEFVIEPGDRIRVADVVVTGNVHIATDTIVKNLRIKAGDAWREEQLAKSRQRLFKLGLFSKVTIGPADGSADGPTETLLVSVEERPLNTLEVGFGVNSEYGLHLFGLATDRQFFADGRALAARADVYYDQLSAEITHGVASFSYNDPAFLSSNYGLLEDLRFQRLEQTSLPFDLDRVSISSYLHRAWGPHWTASGGHTFMLENLDNVDSDSVLSPLDTGTHNLGFLSGVLGYDHRDNPLSPSSGYQFNLEPRVAGSVLGSEADYYGLEGRASTVQPLESILTSRFSLALAGRAASSWTYGPTDYVPISQRYFLGGRNSVRGFRENSLGPRGSEDSVQGGDLLLQQNAEFRYLAADSASVHLFLDSGGLFLKKQGIDGRDYRESTGFGARYLSPIGPIGFDVGFPIDRRPGEPTWRFHFSIGTNF